MEKKVAKKLKFLLLVGVLSLISVGCIKEEPTPQESLFIIWNSPNMRYADQGFLYKKRNALVLEIYSNAQPAITLSINQNQVCSSGLCISKESFNKKYLSANYPKDLIDKILNAKPIFNSKGLKKIDGGFTQKIKKSGKFNIEYRVQNGSIIFKDTLNNITIKIKKG